MSAPARTAPRNPYPHCHKISKTLPLLAQNLGPNPYPYWHKSTKKGTLCGTTIVEQWLIGTIVGAYRRKFSQFCTIFWHSTLSLAQLLENPYPFWHTFGIQNPTLSGTLIKTPTLYGTEVGQNGTLAILAYVYCRQWECPPPPPGNIWIVFGLRVV